MSKKTIIVEIFEPEDGIELDIRELCTHLESVAKAFILSQNADPTVYEFYAREAEDITEELEVEFTTP